SDTQKPGVPGAPAFGATGWKPGRDRILERIRAGLRAAPPSVAAVPPTESTIFEPVSNPRERFQQAAKANLMECLPATGAAARAQNLAQVLDSLPPGEIFVQDAPGLRRLLEAVRTTRAIRWSSHGAPSEASQATLTLARALIAQTGSVFVTASCGGR